MAGGNGDLIRAIIKGAKSEQELQSQCENISKEALLQWLWKIKDEAHIVNREEWLMLEILKQMDFTIWACDRELKIQLWEGSCEKIYGKKREEAIGQNYLDMFVAPLEQYQSKKDALHIIDTGEPQGMRYCEDVDSRGFPIQVITQCCRIIEKKDGKEIPLQAEMAINANIEKLIRESEEFISIQKTEQKEIERSREDCISKLEACKKRILEAAEKRSDHFYSFMTNPPTVKAAIAAVEALISIRNDFSDFYQEELKKLRSTACPCDLASQDYDVRDYTLENGHTFNCVFRKNNRAISAWTNKIDLKEIEYLTKVADVKLEPQH